LHAQGLFAEALTEFQSALAIMETLAKDPPSNLRQHFIARAFMLTLTSGLDLPSPDDTQQELARIQRSIGEARRAQGDLGGALAAHRKAVRIIEALTAKVPAQALWQRDLAVYRGKAGLDLLAEGDTAGARAEIRGALEIMTPIAVLDPTNAGWQQDLAELHRENGDASKTVLDDAGARKEYEACAGITEPIVSLGSTNKMLTELAAYCRSQIAAAGNGKGQAEATPGPMP